MSNLEDSTVQVLPIEMVAVGSKAFEHCTDNSNKKEFFFFFF